MRNIHRWLAPVPALFMIFIAATGIGLQLDLLLSGNSPPGSEPAPSPASSPSQAVTPEQMHRMLDVLVRAAAAESPSLALNRVQLDFAGPRPQASVGRPPDSVKFDLSSGDRIIEPPRPVDLHFILQDLHAGYAFGMPGRLLSLALGVVLLILGVSGLWVYVDMYRRRSRNGRRSLFW